MIYKTDHEDARGDVIVDPQLTSARQKTDVAHRRAVKIPEPTLKQLKTLDTTHINRHLPLRDHRIDQCAI